MRKPKGWVNPGATGSAPNDSGNAGGNDNGNGGGFDADEPFDPASVGTGSGDGDNSGPDAYARDSAGNVLRNKDGSARRKRGRKAGGGSAGGKSRSGAYDLKASIDALTNMLAISHMGIATVTNTPEMMLTEPEAKELAGALVPVLDQFNFAPDPRFAAVFGLMIVAGKIYVPRAVQIRSRKSNAPRAPKPAPAPSATVTPIRPEAPPPNGFSDFGGPLTN